MARGSTPRIATSLFNGLRAQLIREARWEPLEREVLDAHPDLAEWLARSEREPWLPLEPYLRLMDGLERALGADGMHALGRERLRADLEVGALAPMLRGWVREFASDPEALLRVSPHVWSAITQHAGAMRIAGAEPGRLRFRVGPAPGGLLEATGWHRLFEGFGEELARRAGRQASVSVSPDRDASELELSCAWSAPAG